MGQQMRKGVKEGKIKDDEKQREKSTVNKTLNGFNKTFRKDNSNTTWLQDLITLFLLQNITMCVNMKLLQSLIQNDIKEKGTVAFHKAIHDMTTTPTSLLNRYVPRNYEIVKNICEF